MIRGLSCLAALFATAHATPGDASVLLQTQVDTRGIPDEPEPDRSAMPLKIGDDLDEPIEIGSRMEVISLEGSTAGQWLRCKVIAPGHKPNTFDVKLTGVKRLIPDVPADALRKIEEDPSKTDGILLFWAASSRTKDTIKKNIDHLRQNYSGRADVFLVHYDGLKSDWLAEDKDWYAKNVQFSEVQDMPKQYSAAASMLFATAYYPPQIGFARHMLPQLLVKRQYQWIWLLDEDIDFSQTNLTKLFEDAQHADSLIVAPAVKFEERVNLKPSKLYSTGCNKGQEMCFMHVSKPECRYRYTNFVEAMFPLMRQDAFNSLATCADCVTQIDRLWCSHSARDLKFDHTEACAILDQVSVTHTNSKTLRKWEAAHQVHNGMDDTGRAHEADFVYAGDLADYKCVKPTRI